MTTTTLPAPRRISTISYLVADLTTALFGPDHKGADELWFAELRKTAPASRAAVPHPDDTPTVTIPAVRRPIAAIAATAEYAVDELGPWKPQQHQMEPARLYAAMVDERDMTGAFPVVAVAR